MGLSFVTPLGSSPVSAESAPSALAPQIRALNQAVSAAVSRLNAGGYLGENREVQHSLAPGTHTPVIQVIDTQTREVITQWPPEYLLQLAAEINAKTRDSG
jgi:uncharacterized FlaG/YvyC family protein